MPTKITIAIPFYQGLDYLHEAIRSVLGQTMSDWRLVVSDDQGTDEGVGSAVAAYADDRIRYTRNSSRLGISGNFNRCLDLADAELVTLLHADDRLSPDYCRLMIDAAARHSDCTALFCKATIIDAQGRPCFSLPDFIKRFYVPEGRGDFSLTGESGLRAILRGNFIMCPSVCYRMTRLSGRRFSTRWNMVHDLDFFCRLLLDGDVLIGLRQTAYAYRRHPANTTLVLNQSLVRFQEDVRLCAEIADASRAKGWKRASRVARQMRMVKLNLGYRILSDLAGGHFRRARDKVRLLTAIQRTGLGGASIQTSAT